MTGVWSLGSEMLRNIESFWCPIRFRSDLKCDNCKLDFPDVDGAWVPFDSDIATAAAKAQEMYPGPNGVNGWFGHPTRLTHEGQSLASTALAPPEQTPADSAPDTPRPGA
jgi:hypothetical protein